MKEGEGVRKETTEFEISCYSIVCRGESFTQFSGRWRTGCEGCQKGENSIALGQSKRKT